jgi:very-short-patch-repair endonuclease
LSKTKNNVLVALMNNQKDFLIAQEKLWYRIPVKSAPPIIREGTAKMIAFYQTKEFEKEKFTIKWFSEIKKISVVKRRELFPNEPANAKTENEYYKIGFAPLRQLQIPIISLRPRRVLFIPTTEERFFGSKEINFLFNNSPLEDKFWNEMLKNSMYAEREYFISAGAKNFFLDFALFCKNKNIDVEVDGDHYHMDNDSVRFDKQRNNLLESKGWSVLRFTSKDIEYDLTNSINIVRETVNKYGGIQNAKDPKHFMYLNNDEGQTKMFN